MAKLPSRSLALGAILAFSFLTSCGRATFPENPPPDNDLRNAASQFALALTNRDRASLASLNGQGYRDDYLGNILAHYGGLKSEIVGYETEDPTTSYAVKFRAKCPNGKSVHFYQGFFSIDGSWHPIFGDLKSPPAEPIPTVEVPSGIVGTPIPKESC